MANYLNQQLQDFARAAGAVYQGDGMGLHHFKELSTNSNFSLRIPPAGSRECITSDKILVRAQEARRSYGKPEPEAVTEAAKSLRVQCGNGNTVDGWYDRLSRNWVVQVKDNEETQIGDAEYSGSRGSFENSMQCLIDQNGGRVCETTGTASVGAGSTARRHRSKPEDEDRDLPIDLIESIAEIPSTDADEPSGYMLDGNDLIALQQTASGEAADSEVQSWLEECGLIADGQVTPHGQRILDGNAAH
jgi:hypothetical protein